MKNKIVIIIPVLNRKEFTKNCCLSLRKQTYKNFKTVIIDDGSTDGTAEMLEKDFPEVYVIKGDGNLWWTAATNLGIKYALENRADYILTLNNDTIATKDFLEKMVFWAKKTPNALLGAFAIDKESKKPIYGGEIEKWSLADSISLLDVIPKEKWHGLHYVTYFPGRGLLIPSNVFKTIGLYDERKFPHYMADYEYTARAINAGFSVYCNYDAKIYIYPNYSGEKENRKQKKIVNYYNHLFGIKGGGNLKNFTRYGLKYCPKKYLIQYLMIGYIRRILGFWIH